MMRKKENFGGHTKKKVVHHDLDALAGSWTKQEAKQFEKTLAAQRSIDIELWNDTNPHGS